METLNALIKSVDWESVALIGFHIVLIILFTLLIANLLTRILHRMETRLLKHGITEGEPPDESRKRANTIMLLSRQALILVIWIIAGLMVLKELGIEIGPILAGAGVLGLAIGFGAQSLVKDFIAGFFLVLENQVRVGDVAHVNGEWGIVEQINFRTLVLRNLSGEVHIFPNGSITTLSNLTNDWSAYVFEIGVAYKENTDHVVEVINQAGYELRADPQFSHLIIEALEIFGVDQFADSAVIIKGRIKTKPMRQWEVGREFLRRVKLAFDAAGIEIPFPHRTVYFGKTDGSVAIAESMAQQGNDI